MPRSKLAWPPDPEARIVAWLLNHYGLWLSRTRLMLRDLNERICDDAPHLIGENPKRQRSPRRLTLRAFDQFFAGQFPVCLIHQKLTRGQAADMDVGKVMTRLEATRFGRDFGLETNWPRDQRPVGNCYVWPYERDPGKTLVVHNHMGIDPQIAGPHYIYTFSDRTSCIVETLESMIGSVDAQHPPGTWRSAALDPGYADDLPVHA